jgi:archaellum biogenesis ATPase FlaH
LTEPSLEKKVVAACYKDRAAFHRIAAASDIDEHYTPYTSYLLQCAERYYERDESAKKIDPDIVLEWIKTDIPTKNQDIYEQHLKTCYSVDVSAVNIADLVVATKAKHIGNQLAAALIDNKNPEKITTLLGEYNSLTDVAEEEEDEEYNSVSVADVVKDATDTSMQIKLLPNELNRITKGKTKRGHHIVVFARPETGKTALTLTLTRGFAAQGLTGIIFGNEEPVRDTILRAICCFTGMTEEEILADPAKAQALLDKRGWKNVRFIPLNPGTPREISRYVERYKPDFIIVDQIRNLYVGAETRVNQLEMAATAMRNIGKKYDCLVVSVTQAGDSADNKLFLEMGDIDFSNTGIPATADLMLGMGVNKSYDEQGLRGMSTPKNKIGGVHGSFTVKINQPISRLEDL